MRSPFTGGKVEEVYTREEVDFRGDKYDVVAIYYECLDTGEHFTESWMDEICLNDLYCQYRQRHGVPNKTEIKKIREHYGLNYSQISKLLGLGRNQFPRYEKGEVPTESNGKLIVSLKSCKTALSYLETSRQEFEDKDYAKIKKQIQEAGDVPVNNPLTQYFGTISNDINNGFNDFDFNKVSEMVLYIINKLGTCYKSKLNKCMYFCDFRFFKKYCKSISGLQYMAIQYGPVPKCYDTLYDNIDSIKREYTNAHGDIAIKFSSDPITPTLLNSKELEVIDEVVSFVSRFTTLGIEDESHKEHAWKKYVGRNCVIPYYEAFLD